MDLVVIDHRQITQLISHSFSSTFFSPSVEWTPTFFVSREGKDREEADSRKDREKRERERDETQCARERVLRVWEKGENERERERELDVGTKGRGSLARPELRTNYL